MRYLFLVLFYIIFFKVEAQLTLSKVADMPEPVSNNAVVEGFINDTCYAFSFGGIDSTKLWSGIHLRSFRYNTITDVWDTIPSLPDTLGKIAAGASYVDSIIYIIGGYHVYANHNEASSAKVHRYNPKTNSYLNDGMDIPVPIDDHVQAVWKDSLIYVITGWSNTGNVPNVQIYDPANDNWLTGTPTPNNNTYKAFGASGTIMGDSIYYHGGASNGLNFPCQSTLRIGHINPTNPTQITWYFRNTPFLGYRSGCFNPFDFNQEVHWIGGSSTTYNYNGIAYNGSGSVQPSNSSIYYLRNNDSINAFPLAWPLNIPMDLRGIAKIDGPYHTGLGLIAGGMDSNQVVSKKTYIIDFIITNTQKKNKLTSFKTYPNPTSSQINLLFDNVEDKTIQLIDVLGNVVLTEQNNSNNIQLNLSNYPKGVYFVKVTASNNSSTQKIIVQ